ncbi:hypothetical protein POV27_06585 [Aureisphaera galaxeae]|uniref:hypothetical protein n=1 Tax=Aureisphaera galaxeae TaxID=1538023 RepID=UPI00234FB66F|nr:hypothetical protein [Aureisphaera galaxeae]MDC8003710.1 hypothetical protein [Aureisphaera galaxeae]
MRDTIHQLPKADVHNHFHLGGTMQRLNTQYPQANITVPDAFNGLEGMIDFIYGTLNEVMCTTEDVVFFMEMALESAIADNVTLLRASVDIGLARFFDHSIDRVLAEVVRLQEKYKDQIDFRPDVGVNKDLALEKVYSDGVRCISSGLFHGVDIYGKENGKDLTPFNELFQEARKHELKTKVHIGEFSDHQTIEETILLLSPDEIQHGIRAVDSEKTMDLILEHKIRLNICPHSNVALGATKSLKEHPMRTLFDHGINITVNTDDLLLFDATLTDQFVDLLNEGVFSFEEVNRIRENAFD